MLGYRSWYGRTMAAKRQPTKRAAPGRLPGRLPDGHGIGAMLAEPKRPSPGEIADAIEEWRAAEHASKIAYDLAVEARVKLVDVLHRAGLNGFSL